MINEEVTPSGPVRCINKGDLLSDGWFTVPDWEDDSRFRVEAVRFQGEARAHGGHALRLSGVTGGRGQRSVAAGDMGVYYMQPPYDDINGRPHYIKDADGEGATTVAFGGGQGGPGRRHMFFSTRCVAPRAPRAAPWPSRARPPVSSLPSPAWSCTQHRGHHGAVGARPGVQ